MNTNCFVCDRPGAPCHCRLVYLCGEHKEPHACEEVSKIRSDLVAVKFDKLCAIGDIPKGTPVALISVKWNKCHPKISDSGSGVGCYTEYKSAYPMYDKLLACKRLNHLDNWIVDYTQHYNLGNAQIQVQGSTAIAVTTDDVKAGRVIYTLLNHHIPIITTMTKSGRQYTRMLCSLWLILQKKFIPDSNMPVIFPAKSRDGDHIVLVEPSTTDRMKVLLLLMDDKSYMESVVNKWLKIFGFNSRGWDTWSDLLTRML